MRDIPLQSVAFAVIRHAVPFPVLPNDEGDQFRRAQVEQSDYHGHYDHEDQHDAGGIDQILTAGPGNLLQFRPSLLDGSPELLGKLRDLGEETVLLHGFFIALRRELVFHIGHCFTSFAALKRSAGFLVRRVLLAERAVLIELDAVGVGLLVLGRGILALLAFRASESDFHAGADSHVNYLHFLFNQEMTDK